MKIGACYIRVSTNDQLEYSPDSQLTKIQEYAQRNGIYIPQEFIYIEQEGVSGRDARKRQKFQQMIGAAKSKPKPFDIIILWKFSRFARNREDSIVYKSMLRKQLGIEVVSVSETIGDDKISMMTEAFIEAMDEYYSINLGEEVKRGMLQKVQKGEAVAIPPYGYEMINKQYVPNEQAQTVQMIFSEYLNGKGCFEIAKTLNELGYKTRRGNAWENRTVEYILRNPVYIGKIRWNPTGKTDRSFSDAMVVEGTHRPIVSQQVFEDVQKKLDETKKKYAKYARVRSECTFMLQGLIRCSNCGSALSMASAHESLQCYQYTHGKCLVSHSITISQLDATVISAVHKAFSNESIELSAKRGLDDKAKEFDIETQLIKAKSKLERIKDAYEEGVYTLSEYKERRDHAQSLIQNLEARQTTPTHADAQKRKRQSIQMYLPVISVLQSANLNASEKNNFLKSFIDTIIFDRPRSRIDIFFSN